jgi:hypothetical protein
MEEIRYLGTVFESALDQVSSSVNYRVCLYEPNTARPISAIESARTGWSNFRRSLRPCVPRCTPRAERLGGLRVSAAQPEATRLADEGQVVVAAGGVRDGGAAVGRDSEIGQVRDVPAVDRN